MMKYNMLEAATVGDAKKLMEVLDAGVEQLDDIWLASITLQKVSGKATKEELSHMAALGKRLVRSRQMIIQKIFRHAGG